MVSKYGDVTLELELAFRFNVVIMVIAVLLT